MSISLVKHGRIFTTLPRAKVLRPFIEKLVTRARDLHHTLDPSRKEALFRELLGSLANNEAAVRTLTMVWGPLVWNRPGGYTRILKYGFRKGDAAPMAMIEFVIEDQVDSADQGIGGDDFKEIINTFGKKAVGIRPTNSELSIWRELPAPACSVTVLRRSLAEELLVRVEVSLPPEMRQFPSKRTGSSNFGQTNWPVRSGRPVPMRIDLMMFVPIRERRQITWWDGAPAPAKGGAVDMTAACLGRMPGVSLALSQEAHTKAVWGLLRLDEESAQLPFASLTVFSPGREIWHGDLLHLDTA